MSKQRHIDNKKAFFDYDLSETLEAGLVLNGPEIKSFRAGLASIKTAFVRSLNSGPKGQPELWLINGHFSKSLEPNRSRKLLAHRKEIDRLIGRVAEKGLTLVPIEMYLSHGQAKIKIGLGRGKKQFEKRESIKKRDIDRELRRSVKS